MAHRIGQRQQAAHRRVGLRQHVGRGQPRPRPAPSRARFLRTKSKSVGPHFAQPTRHGGQRVEPDPDVQFFIRRGGDQRLAQFGGFIRSWPASEAPRRLPAGIASASSAHGSAPPARPMPWGVASALLAPWPRAGDFVQRRQLSRSSIARQSIAARFHRAKWASSRPISSALPSAALLPAKVPVFNCRSSHGASAAPQSECRSRIDEAAPRTVASGDCHQPGHDLGLQSAPRHLIDCQHRRTTRARIRTGQTSGRLFRRRQLDEGVDHRMFQRAIEIFARYVQQSRYCRTIVQPPECFGRCAAIVGRARTQNFDQLRNRRAITSDARSCESRPAAPFRQCRQAPRELPPARRHPRCVPASIPRKLAPMSRDVARTSRPREEPHFPRLRQFVHRSPAYGRPGICQPPASASDVASDQASFSPRGICDSWPCPAHECDRCRRPPRASTIASWGSRACTNRPYRSRPGCRRRLPPRRSDESRDCPRPGNRDHA